MVFDDEAVARRFDCAAIQVELRFLAFGVSKIPRRRQPPEPRLKELLIVLLFGQSRL